MIRINLLAVDRGRVKKARAAAAGVTAAQRVTIGAALIFLSTIVHDRLVVLVAPHQLDPPRRGHRAPPRSRPQQLRSVLAQVQKFETRKAVLQQRVTLIEQLRRGQSAPVHVLDEISKAIPDRLWLVSLGAARQGLHDGRAHDRR